MHFYCVANSIVLQNTPLLNWFFLVSYTRSAMKSHEKLVFDEYAAISAIFTMTKSGNFDAKYTNRRALIMFDCFEYISDDERTHWNDDKWIKQQRQRTNLRCACIRYSACTTHRSSIAISVGGGIACFIIIIIRSQHLGNCVSAIRWCCSHAIVHHSFLHPMNNYNSIPFSVFIINKLYALIINSLPLRVFLCTFFTHTYTVLCENWSLKFVWAHFFVTGS